MSFFESIIAWDKYFTFLLSNLIPHSFPFNDFFKILAPKIITALIWALIFAFLFFSKKKKERRSLFYSFILSLTLAFFFSNLIFKPLFTRQRPSKAAICPKDYSFPSGHTTFSFAASYILSFFNRKRKYLYYMIATTVGYSRIYLGCHWFLDVVAGAFLGILISKMVLKIKFKMNLF